MMRFLGKYLAMKALDLSPTQMTLVLAAASGVISCISFLIALQIEEWTPPANPLSEVIATYKFLGCSFSQLTFQRHLVAWTKIQVAVRLITSA